MTISESEAAAIVHNELTGHLHHEMLLMNGTPLTAALSLPFLTLRVAPLAVFASTGKEYFITTVNRRTMFARGVSPNAGAVVVCRFPRHLALLVSPATKYLPATYCETWTDGVHSIISQSVIL